MEKKSFLDPDRLLMRLKDLIIIGTAIAALIRWAYNTAQDQTQRFKNLEDRMVNVERFISINGRRKGE